MEYYVPWNKLLCELLLHLWKQNISTLRWQGRWEGWLWGEKAQTLNGNSVHVKWKGSVSTLCIQWVLLLWKKRMQFSLTRGIPVTDNQFLTSSAEEQDTEPMDGRHLLYFLHNSSFPVHLHWQLILLKPNPSKENHWKVKGHARKKKQKRAHAFKNETRRRDKTLPQQSYHSPNPWRGVGRNGTGQVIGYLLPLELLMKRQRDFFPTRMKI